jgi:hypothetical protein
MQVSNRLGTLINSLNMLQPETLRTLIILPQRKSHCKHMNKYLGDDQNLNFSFFSKEVKTPDLYIKIMHKYFKILIQHNMTRQIQRSK